VAMELFCPFTQLTHILTHHPLFVIDVQFLVVQVFFRDLRFQVGHVKQTNNPDPYLSGPDLIRQNDHLSSKESVLLKKDTLWAQVETLLHNGHQSIPTCVEFHQFIQRWEALINSIYIYFFWRVFKTQD
jgi:hypothetical protein